MKPPETDPAAIARGKTAENRGPAPAATSPAGPAATDGSGSAPGTPAKLTAEEQMALYEEHLKENDWGHQPC